MPTTKIIATLTALAATLIAPLTSHAILVTLDNPNQTILRPTTGTTTVSFTGNIDITEGYRLTSAAASSLWTASGDLVEGRFPRPTFDLTGVLFTVLVGATDSGLYAFDSLLTNPAYILFAECPLGGGYCNNTGRLNYSVNVVDSLNVPEPATLSLFGAALLMGFAVQRRRWRVAPTV